MTELKSVVFPLCAGICALAFLYKLRDLRPGRRDPALLALLVAFLFKGVSFTLSTPVVSAGVDKYLGVPDLGALGIHLAGGVTSSAAFLAALVFWVYPAEQAWPKVRRRITVFALVAATMLVLWYTAGSGGGRARSAHYLLENAHRPVIAAYLLLYVTAFAAGMAEIFRLGRRYAKAAGRPWLRRGLKTTSVGAIIYIAYCANRAWAVVAVQFGLNPLEWEIVTPLSNGIGILLVAAGFTMPSWGPALSAARVWAANYRAYHRLYPLWSALYRATPEIALNPPAPSFIERFRPGDLRYRLYRRVIEIRDGLLVMRPYMDAEAAAEATRKAHEAGLEGDARDAAVEAARLKAALRAKAEDQSVPGGPSGGDPPSHASGDYAGELGWLLKMAKAYADAPGEQGEVRNGVPSAR
ncbi:MAB_1171c family putative transporter [Streptomyces winkii]|uniref:MAB_1171c family putative transporter n=1 Tax=Streptomyces winkii TaxID=3051178 RepID=UPI0028D4A051|nr:MAB_1171c family putative transporter [Streptomyces sp. DSM 40971]